MEGGDGYSRQSGSEADESMPPRRGGKWLERSRGAFILKLDQLLCHRFEHLS